MLKGFRNYLVEDFEKRSNIDNLLSPPDFNNLGENLIDECYMKLSVQEPTRYCPDCHKLYLDSEIICFNCLTRLKKITDIPSVRQIKTKPEFPFNGKNTYNDFKDIFTSQNLEKINRFITCSDYRSIITNIKRTSLGNLNSIISENDLLIDFLNIPDIVLLYVKSFVNVDFKSHGPELGFYNFNKISVDERLTQSLLITTLIHEVSHFILNEIITELLCTILDCDKNSYIESVSTFILSYSNFTGLIDEYCAHTVEGRFTVFGYQDYSSFIRIEKTLNGEMSDDEIEITKSIANTLSLSIKDILESFLDDELREDIKDIFIQQNIEKPDYEMLKMENCNLLNDEGFIKAMWLVISQGFMAAGENLEKLEEYEKFFNIY